MLNIGPQELLLILVVALLVVGPQRLPELSRQIGKGLREFRKVQDEVKGIARLDLDDEPAGSTPRAPASPTAPSVHRTPRPAPAPPPADEASNGSDPGAPPADATG
jgi:sec-independent protein translocase protein TatB